MCVCVISSFVQCLFLILFCNLYLQRTMQKVISKQFPFRFRVIVRPRGGGLGIARSSAWSADGKWSQLTTLCECLFHQNVANISMWDERDCLFSTTTTPYWRATFDGAIRVRSSCPCPEMKACRYSFTHSKGRY